MKRNFLLILLAAFFVNLLSAQGSIQSLNKTTQQFSCYFAYNSASWPADSVAKFKAWFTPYLKKREVTVDLLSYTDTIGTLERNKDLAQRRLNSVQSYFRKQNLGINETAALGESYDQSNYKKDQLYRRVDVVVRYLEPLQEVQSSVEIPAEKSVEARMEEFAASTEPISLDIQFVGGQDVYIGNSYLEVEALFLYLKKNKNKKAYIRGHVCCANDYELSHLRAYAVYRDLLSKGISPTRISFQGFGNTIPVAQEVDEPSRQLNRRVDVIFSDL